MTAAGRGDVIGEIRERWNSLTWIDFGKESGGGMITLSAGSLSVLRAAPSDIATLLDHIAALEAALGQYADEGNWGDSEYFGAGEPDVVWRGDGDYGYSVARVALDDRR